MFIIPLFILIKPLLSIVNTNCELSVMYFKHTLSYEKELFFILAAQGCHSAYI